MAAICHKSLGPGHLSPSFNPPFLPSVSWTPRGSGQSPLTRYQTFWCNLCSQTAL